MINWLHSRFRRPERGWDPIPPAYASKYAEYEWGRGAQAQLLDELDDWVGGLAGKSVLDLGAGPGHYSIAFVQRGAHVTSFDVSARYREIALVHAAEAGVDIRYRLGYMDEAPDILGETFDIVFNRICWNYGRGDASFSKVIWRLVKPGGAAYVDTMLDNFAYRELSGVQRLGVWLNRYMNMKIGHPYPPRGRLGRLFARCPVERLLIDSSLPMNDRIYVRKRS